MDKTRLSIALIYTAVLSASIAAGASRIALARYLRFELGAPVVIVASLTTWFMAMRAISSTLFGVIADRSPGTRKTLMSLPMLGIGVIVYAISYTRDVLLVLLANALWGFLGGIVWPITQTVTSLIARQRSGTVMSIYFALGSLGVTTGIYLYGLLPFSNPDSIRMASLFFFIGGFTLILASQYLGTLPISQQRKHAVKTHSASRFSSRKTRLFSIWLLLAAFSAGYAAGIMKEFLYVYLSEAYGLDKYTLSLVLSISGIAAFLVGLLVGPLADRKGVTTSLTYILLMGLLGGLTISIAPSIAWAALGVALVTSSARGSLPLTRNAAFFATAYAATLVGLSNTFSNIGQVISPVLAGILYDLYDGLRIAGIEAKAIPFLSIALLYALVLVLRPRVEKRKSL